MAVLVTSGVQVARFANALYGIKLGFNTNASVQEDVANFGLSATVNAYYNYSFGAKTSAEVASIILGNVGLAGNTAAQAFIVGQLDAAGTAKGQAVLSMLNAFANMTSDASFGAAATAWNSTVASALVYTATNPEDVAVTASTIQTYVLKAGVEVVTRTSGDDIIMAPLGSMNSLDVTDGGAGVDTLIIEGIDGDGGKISAGAFTNIEKVILNSFEQFGEVLTINADDFQGVQQIWLEDSSVNDYSDPALVASNLANSILFGLKGKNSGEWIDLIWPNRIALEYKTLATTSKISLDELDGKPLVKIAGENITTLELSGSVVTPDGLPMSADVEVAVRFDQIDDKDKINNVNINANRLISFDISEIKTITKVDASTSTGNIFAIINQPYQSSRDTNLGVTYLGGTGNDYVHVNLNVLDLTDVLRGNGGTDTLLLNIDQERNEITDDSSFDENYKAIWSGGFSPTNAQYALINKTEFEKIDFDGYNFNDYYDLLILDANSLSASNIGTDDRTIFLNLENTDTVHYIETDTSSTEPIDLLAKRDEIASTKYASGAGTVNLVVVYKDVFVEVSANKKQAVELGEENFSDFNKLIVTGAGDVGMYNVFGFGVEIDASGLKGKLDFEPAYDSVDKITLGAGKDTVDLYQYNVDGENGFLDALSDYGSMDTITGFTSGQDKFVIRDFYNDDDDDGFADGYGEPGVIKYLAYTGDLGVDFSQTVSLALMAAKDAQADVASFIWSGNTYVVQDIQTDTTDWTGDFEAADDIVVRLTGVVNLLSTDFEAYN